MKTRYELIDYFMQSLVYDDKNNIVDELKREYNANDSEYMQAEKKITNLVPIKDFNEYETATINLTTILVCNAFILGYEQCKKDILNHINGTTKKR